MDEKIDRIADNNNACFVLPKVLCYPRWQSTSSIWPNDEDHFYYIIMKIAKLNIIQALGEYYQQLEIIWAFLNTNTRRLISYLFSSPAYLLFVRAVNASYSFLSVDLQNIENIWLASNVRHTLIAIQFLSFNLFTII